MKKILILGGSHRDIPLIQASKKLGFYVITLGNRDYYLGHNYSNEAIKIDFNDLNKAKQIIKNKNIDFIICGSGEESYINTVKISNELNIGNFDTLKTAQLVHNKWHFKKFCLDNDIPTPKGFYFKNNLNPKDLNFPIVVKPTNLSGGRGIKIVTNQFELNNALQKAQALSDDVFLEEFIEGRLIAYSVFLRNQKIIYAFSGADDTYLNKYLITTAYPIVLDKEVKQKLKININKIAKLLNLVDGMFHLQVIIKNNIPYIIDVTRRIAGDLYPNLIEYCDKIKYSQAVVKAYIKYDITDEFTQIQEKDFVVRHVVMPSRNGIYMGISINNSIKKNILYKLDLMQTNTLINDYLHTQLAIVFVKLDKHNAHILNRLNDLIKVCYK
jgi:biotin carboxylase